jgi:hypothetical protein
MLICAQSPSGATDVKTVKATIVKHAMAMGVDPALALSIAKTESGFRHNATSCHGAVGVFQLMPSTARRMGLNPYSLNDNIKGGILYYKKMYKMFGSTELALAAYNAGPGNVKKYNTIPPFAETKRFVSKIMADYNYQKKYPDAAVIEAKKAVSAKSVPAEKVQAKTTSVEKSDIQPVSDNTELKVETKIENSDSVNAEVVHQVHTEQVKPETTSI